MRYSSAHNRLQAFLTTLNKRRLQCQSSSISAQCAVRSTQGLIISLLPLHTAKMGRSANAGSRHGVYTVNPPQAGRQSDPQASVQSVDADLVLHLHRHLAEQPSTCSTSSTCSLQRSMLNCTGRVSAFSARCGCEGWWRTLGRDRLDALAFTSNLRGSGAFHGASWPRAKGRGTLRLLLAHPIRHHGCLRCDVQSQLSALLWPPNIA